MIKKIVIEINGKDVEMTVEKARELKSQLDELFNTVRYPITIPYPAYPYEPWVPPYNPYPVWSITTDNTGGS